MRRYFGRIIAAPAFGEPLSICVVLTGYGTFADAAQDLQDIHITPYLAANNWDTFSAKISGFAPLKDMPIEYDVVAEDVGLENILDRNMPMKEVITREGTSFVPNHKLKAHEENHKEVMAFGLWDLRAYVGCAAAYFSMLAESLATVIGDMEDLEQQENKKLATRSMNTVSKFGWRLIDIISKAQHGHSMMSLAEHITNTYRAAGYAPDEITWARMLCDVKYYGMYGACLDLVRTHGKEKGKRIVYEVMRLLQHSDGLDALMHLQMNTSQKKSIPVIDCFDVSGERYVTYRTSDGDSDLSVTVYCAAQELPIACAKRMWTIAKTETEKIRGIDSVGLPSKEG